MMTKFFSYSGSKIKYVSLINSFLQTDKEIYIEPFVGSGAIFFNLEKKFKRYILNDSDKNIIKVYESFKNASYNDLLNCKEYIERTFGDIKESKTAYYSFKNWFNMTEHTEIVYGLFLWFLINSCINSFVRFGPNGFNQAFGSRGYFLTEPEFDTIKSKLNLAEFRNTDYKNLLLEFGNTAFYFLDPPYFSQGSSYSSFSLENYLEFLRLIEDKDFLYTDILNEHNKNMNYKLLIRDIRNTAPASDKSVRKTSNLEYLFSSKTLVSKTEKFFY